MRRGIEGTGGQHAGHVVLRFIVEHLISTGLIWCQAWMVITLADLASHRHFTCPNKHPQRFIISVNLIIEICIFEQYNDRRVMPDYRDYCFLF